MFKWLFLIILIIPALEIGILIWSGNIIGPLWVILLIITTGAIGAWLAKREGMETIRDFQDSLQRGNPPRHTLLDGACILVGGAVLLTPGFITDAIGFLLLFPVTRHPIKKVVMKAIEKGMSNGTITIHRR
ncbi:membrane protein FxsA [Salimicrobium jeotgali]|uniref:FxsA protein n=1 Tax=Salimicrobium jeotgali TaxID=1230341 RepID=K2GAK7_9BACI|nr:FxsA family protein [Salimicrobium jeotgali]AKG04145.1 membrane protein FxsA [Salimicrobium jeotgali]EKE32103.1 FxsA protein [Salimicrobium jeotgali]MBM7695713.1 UPF0716 protein FxsA [Salimicrobium jeotgali]